MPPIWPSSPFTPPTPLLKFANRGHKVPDPKLSRFRELIIGSYRLIYLVETRRGVIVALLHGHRALRRALKGRA